LGGLQYGGDLRWATPVKGLLIGASRLDQDTSGKGTALNPTNHSAPPIPDAEHSKADWSDQFYGEYVIGRLRIDSEYRRYVRDQIVLNGTSENLTDVRGWYVSGGVRIAKRLDQDTSGKGTALKCP